VGLKTSQEYIASLKDGRVTYWNGERIADITAHSLFKMPIAIAAADYEYDNPARHDATVYVTEDGSEANRIFQIPIDEEHLRRRIEMFHASSIVAQVTGVYMALLSAKDAVAAINPRYAANIEAVYKNARQNDLRAAEVITDPKGDRKRRANEQDDPDLYLRIVSRNADGIIVRGAKLHITGASLCHELVVLPTKGMKAEEADYAVAFSIPVNTRGVSIINKSFARVEAPEFDSPLSAHHAIPEGFVVFDDVLVPWDRVFLAGEIELAGKLTQSLGLWERTGGLTEAAHRAQAFVGLAQLVAEQQGKERDTAAMSTIAELIQFATMLRIALEYACSNFARTPSGMIHPDILAINAGKFYYTSNYHAMVKLLQDLAGGLVITLPSVKDLENPQSGAYLRKYLHTKSDVSIESRMRVFNAIRDLTADSYGGWLLVTALQAGGGLNAGRIMLYRAFDMKAARDIAKSVAGIT
jgi:4-hydroxybutyryl-CoA dehydratase / vinylacetyl-CoA-Delta-isomerase